jgi:hypothetical protein
MYYYTHYFKSRNSDLGAYSLQKTGQQAHPQLFNVDNTVALFVVKLYALMSYTPELFILQFIIY